MLIAVHFSVLFRKANHARDPQVPRFFFLSLQGNLIARSLVVIPL